MAKFELTIYNDDDSVKHKHETDVVRWGVYIKAVELTENLKDKTNGEKVIAIGQFLKNVFKSLTDDDLLNADKDDILNTFKQLTSNTNNINISKNA